MKQVLRKREIKRTDDITLHEICFKVNQHSQGEKGSTAKRFLKRKPRALLPGSIERIINHNKLVMARQEWQMALATKKGRASADAFEIRDDVVAQNYETKRWSEHRKITAERKADDDSVQNFEILMVSRCTFIRYENFLKHHIAASDQQHGWKRTKQRE